MPLSLQTRVVFPVDRPPIEHGIVAIDGDRIVAVEANAAAGSESRDLGNVAILPGFVNAHTHLEFSHLARPLGTRGMKLPEWIRLVIAERQRAAAPAGGAIDAGLRESIRGGVTTVGEISTAGDAAEYGARYSPNVMLYAEVIGFSRARAESTLAAAAEKLDALQRTSGARDVCVGISPHAPYTVSPDLLERLVGLANRRNLPVAMHLAESEAELELLAHGTGPFQSLLEDRSMWDVSAIPRGSRPLDYLKLLAGAPRSLVIHGNYLDAAERAFLANNTPRMSIVYCPRTHAYFDHPPYPLLESLAAGVPLALGTDSRASNPDLSLWNEMRHIARTHSTMEPHEILRLGTLAGAQALGRADDCGSLAPGKLANLIAVPLPEDARGTPNDLLAALLAAESGPTSVWARGEEIAV